MNKEQLRELIGETLKEIDLYSESAVNLLMGTCAQESHLGEYIKQIKGPALGIFQMEPNTFRDIEQHYFRYKRELEKIVKSESRASHIYSELMVYNLKFSICMARVHYLRVPEKLPNSIEGYAAYWKKYYNTYLGAGTEEEFIHNYKKYVL